MNAFDIIQTDGHKIQACGASTGHFVKTVAMCESAQIADFLMHGVGTADTIAAKDAEIELLRAVVGSMPCVCLECGGDGKETCNNPDHGFIDALGFHEIGRLGCPGCGHDANHKVRNGGHCEHCKGSGRSTLAASIEYAGDEFQERIEFFEEEGLVEFVLSARAALSKQESADV